VKVDASKAEALARGPWEDAPVEAIDAKAAQAETPMFLHPGSRCLVYEVQLRDAEGRAVATWVDAEDGKIVAASDVAERGVQGPSNLTCTSDPNNPGHGSTTWYGDVSLAGLTSQRDGRYEARACAPGPPERPWWLTVFDESPLPPSGLPASDGDNNWGDERVVDLLYFSKGFKELLSQAPYNYDFLAQHGSMQAVARLNAFSANGNAFYHPGSNSIVFGKYGRNFTPAPDVVAHEYTHAISHVRWGRPYVCGGEEAKALNEAFSDLMGHAYKTEAFDQGVPQWVVGRQAVGGSSECSSGGLRDFAHPSRCRDIGGPNAGNPYPSVHPLGWNDFPGTASGPVRCVGGPPDPRHYPGVPEDEQCFATNGPHGRGNTLLHWFWILVNGEFNEDPAFRPTPWGMQPDEHLGFDATMGVVRDAYRTFSVGSSFCSLRDATLLSTPLGPQRTAVYHAWKQAFHQMDSRCPLTRQVDGVPEAIDVPMPALGLSAGTTDLLSGTPLDLGATTPGTPLVRQVQLRNTGRYRLRYRGLARSSGFSIVGPSSGVLEPGQSAGVELRFSSSNLGAATGTLTLESSDYARQNVTVAPRTSARAARACSARSSRRPTQGPRPTAGRSATSSRPAASRCSTPTRAPGRTQSPSASRHRAGPRCACARSWSRPRPARAWAGGGTRRARATAWN